MAKRNDEYSKLKKEATHSEELMKSLKAENTNFVVLRNHANDMESHRDSLSRVLRDVGIKASITQAQLLGTEQELAGKCSVIVSLEDKISNQQSLHENSERKNLIQTDKI